MAGGDSEVLWGLAMGSGKNPYQTLVSLADLASKCSCPSRKFPCKHALGLMFLISSTQAAPSERPQWANEWLESRSARAEKSKSISATKSTKPVDEKAAKKRRAQRESRVSEGIALLRQSLTDLTREGLASGNARSPGFWTDLAKRMVDCQAPGLAGTLRHIGDAVLRDPDADSELPYELGRLHLVIHSLENLESHNPATRAELHSLIGSRSLTEPVPGESLEDNWFIAARKVEERDRLITSTTWMFGTETRRWAKLLRFAPAHQTIVEPWAFGSSVRASLKFQPGLHPMRAVSESENPATQSPVPREHESTLSELLDRFATALAENPFLRTLPFLIPLRPAAHGLLTDSTGQALPSTENPATSLRIECICGGQPTPMCGEWDGRKIRLLAIRDGDTCFPLTRLQP